MNCVFLDRQTFVESVSIKKIEQQVSSVTCYPLTDQNQLIERCISADIVITNKVCFSDETMDLLPKLKLICIAATGTNNVDLIAAKKRNIAVTNVSGYSSNSVSQYVFSQILDYANKPQSHHKIVEQGFWQQSKSFCVHGSGSNELANKTIAIIGYGSLGKAVEGIAQAFSMNIVIAERPSSTTIRDGRVAFTDALKMADFVTLHCPLNAETENLIDAKAFSLMKQTAVLINTARGKIVNEHDLLIALKSGEIAYAILDVLAQEPPSSDYPLLKQQPENLKVTAHIAWASVESQQRLLNLIASNIQSFHANQTANRVE